jgi:hypothetical protein
MQPSTPPPPDSFAITTTLSHSLFLIRMTGTADMTVVEQVADTLALAHREAAAHQLAEVVVDVRATYFVNSSCLKHFVTLALNARESRYRVRFVVDGRLTWQARMFEPMERLAPSLISIEVVAD